MINVLRPFSPLFLLRWHYFAHRLQITEPVDMVTLVNMARRGSSSLRAPFGPGRCHPAAFEQWLQSLLRTPCSRAMFAALRVDPNFTRFVSSFEPIRRIWERVEREERELPPPPTGPPPPPPQPPQPPAPADVPVSPDTLRTTPGQSTLLQQVPLTTATTPAAAVAVPSAPPGANPAAPLAAPVFTTRPLTAAGRIAANYPHLAQALAVVRTFIPDEFCDVVASLASVDDLLFMNRLVQAMPLSSLLQVRITE